MLCHLEKKELLKVRGGKKKAKPSYAEHCSPDSKLNAGEGVWGDNQSEERQGAMK